MAEHRRHDTQALLSGGPGAQAAAREGPEAAARSRSGTSGCESQQGVSAEDDEMGATGF